MSSLEYKIAIIGNQDAVFGFRTIGVDAVAVKSPEEAQIRVKELYNSPEYAVIMITEDWAEILDETLRKLPPKALPAIVAVPSQAGSTGAGLLQLKRIVERAVGSDILADR